MIKKKFLDKNLITSGYTKWLLVNKLQVVTKLFDYKMCKQLIISYLTQTADNQPFRNTLRDSYSYF